LTVNAFPLTLVDKIQILHTRFLEIIKKDPANLCDHFMVILPLLGIYGSYISKYNTHILSLNANSKLAQYCRRINPTLDMQDPHYSAVLVFPLGRIPRYDLLLRQMAKWTLSETKMQKIIQLQSQLGETLQRINKDIRKE
jgi:hypothetical protein